jgi:hypothetical protein
MECPVALSGDLAAILGPRMPNTDLCTMEKLQMLVDWAGSDDARANLIGLRGNADISEIGVKKHTVAALMSIQEESVSLTLKRLGFKNLRREGEWVVHRPPPKFYAERAVRGPSEPPRLALLVAFTAESWVEICDGEDALFLWTDVFLRRASQVFAVPRLMGRSETMECLQRFVPRMIVERADWARLTQNFGERTGVLAKMHLFCEADALFGIGAEALFEPAGGVRIGGMVFTNDFAVPFFGEYLTCGERRFSGWAAAAAASREAASNPGDD